MKRKYVLTRVGGGGGGVSRKAYDCVHGGRGDPIFDIFMRTYYVNGPYIRVIFIYSLL